MIFDIDNYHKWWWSSGADEPADSSLEITVAIIRVRLMAGNVVVVVKYNKKTGLNGEVGVVVGYSVKMAKYKVKFESQGVGIKLIKMGHLMIVF